MPEVGEVSSRQQQMQDSVKNSSLSNDEFLKLLLTELKFQDPFENADFKDLMLQLSQLGQMEQMLSMRETIEGLRETILSLNMASAMNLVGKSVEAEGNEIVVKSNTPTNQIVLDVQNSSSKVIVDITDATGQVVRTLTLSSVKPGRVDVVWDGKDSRGFAVPDGQYTASAYAADMTGKTTSLPTFVKGKATGVIMGKDAVQVEISDLVVDFLRVRRVVEEQEGGE